MPPRHRRAEAHVSAESMPAQELAAPEGPTQQLIAPESSRWSNANMTAAQNFENRVTDPIESGKEVVRMAGQNSASPANSFEARIQQAI